MTKEKLLENKQISFGLHQDNSLDEVLQVMDEYAKQQSILFQEYHRRYRHEEGVAFKKECDRLGGMFSLADVGIGYIYDLFVKGVEIKSESMPGVIYQFPIGQEPIVIFPEKKTP